MNIPELKKLRLIKERYHEEKQGSIKSRLGIQLWTNNLQVPEKKVIGILMNYTLSNKDHINEKV